MTELAGDIEAHKMRVPWLCLRANAAVLTMHLPAEVHRGQASATSGSVANSQGPLQYRNLGVGYLNDSPPGGG
jgi:hypothetical protein